MGPFGGYSLLKLINSGHSQVAESLVGSKLKQNDNCGTWSKWAQSQHTHSLLLGLTRRVDGTPATILSIIRYALWSRNISEGYRYVGGDLGSGVARSVGFPGGHQGVLGGSRTTEYQISLNNQNPEPP